MSKQLEIEIPIEQRNSDNYKTAMEEYEKDKKLKDLHPVHFCYNPVNGKFFVSRFFQKESIESYKCKIIH
jgi:hypothetical protein